MDELWIRMDQNNPFLKKTKKLGSMDNPVQIDNMHPPQQLQNEKS